MLPHLRHSGAIRRAVATVPFCSRPSALRLAPVRCDRWQVCARAVQRFFGGSGWENHSDAGSGEDTHYDDGLDPDVFLAGLLERVQLGRGGHGGSASFAAMWGDGYRDDLDTDWMEAISREGIDPEGERVLAVLPFSSHIEEGAMEWPAKMEEALSLCGSLGRWDVVDALALRARHGRGQAWGKGPNRKLYLRPGQVKMVAQAVQQTECDAVFVDAILTPLQARNLGVHLGVEHVYDRFGLILAIFDANATTR